jgi:hypothetical protein
MNLSLIAILFAVGANAGTDHARIKKAVWTGLDSVPCRNAASHGGKVDGMLPAYGEVDVLCQQTGDNYGPGVKNKIWVSVCRPWVRLGFGDFGIPLTLAGLYPLRLLCAQLPSGGPRVPPSRALVQGFLLIGGPLRKRQKTWRIKRKRRCMSEMQKKVLSRLDVAREVITLRSCICSRMVLILHPAGC